MAGESARELARRQREKAARLTRAAEMYERGAEGEEATATVLAELPSQWTVIHDVRWPGRPRANIDHVVIGPAGLFVIDSKNWSGPVTVTGDVLRQGRYKREETVVGAAEAALAVGRLVPDLDIRLVVPVLCFARDEDIRGWARDVMVCSTANLLEMLMSREPKLAESETVSLTRDLQKRVSQKQIERRPRPASRAERARRRSRGRRLRALVGLLAVGIFLSFRAPITDRVADFLVPTVEVETPEPAGPKEPGSQPGTSQDKRSSRTPAP